MKNSLQSPRRLAALFLLVASAACSDGSTNTSGVSRSIKVTDVTDAQAEKVCEWSAKQVEEADVSEREACVAEIAPFSESASECKADVDLCVKDLADNPEEPTEEVDCSGGAPELGGSCSQITVGDFEICVKAFINEIEKVIKQASCNKPGEEPDYSRTAAALPSSCRTILANCPEILPPGLVDTDDYGIEAD